MDDRGYGIVATGQKYSVLYSEHHGRENLTIATVTERGTAEIVRVIESQEQIAKFVAMCTMLGRDDPYLQIEIEKLHLEYGGP